MTGRTIFLARHAEHVGQDGIKRYIGQSDFELTLLGRQQARQLAQALRNYEIQHVFCSDLTRAKQTAAIIGDHLHCEPVATREFREVNTGQWEGKSFAEIQSAFPDQFERRGRDIVNHRPPGGESFADLAKRVLPAFDHVVNTTDGNILIVAHSGVNRVILCHLLHLPLQDMFAIKQDCARVNIIRITGEGYTVLGINENLSVKRDLSE